MIFDLPDINPDADPAFTDAKTCAEWLQALPLINVAPSHGKLLAELEEINCVEMLPSERIRILELLREAVLFLQSEMATKFTGKAVPLSSQERMVFLNVVALWSAFALGWQRCLEDLTQGIGGVSGQAALICQRTLGSAGLKLAEHYKVYQEFGADEWLRLNQVYAFAESSGVAAKGVGHPSQKHAPELSCTETFAQIQLLALANPNEHSPRQQALVERWAGQWAHRVVLSDQIPRNSDTEPLSVDLGGDACATRAQKENSPGLRYLDTREIGKRLTKRIAALKQGEAPDTLGLGNDVNEGLAAHMLVVLKHRWCEGKTARQVPRRGVTQHAQLCCGIGAIHYFITGRHFESQNEVSGLTSRQREHIETFGQLSTRDNENRTLAKGFTLEQWKIIDESLSGFRLQRQGNSGNIRFLYQQLVAVRPSDTDSFFICSVRWLSMAGDSSLRIGTRAMPGVPQGIALRRGGIKTPTDKYVAALMLPAVPALRSPATLIIPAGWFRPKRMIEVRSDVSEQVLLTNAIERGSDFERCTFEMA